MDDISSILIEENKYDTAIVNYAFHNQSFALFVVVRSHLLFMFSLFVGSWKHTPD